MSGTTGGDMTREVSCFICGQTVVNTRLPQHVHSEDCSDGREAGESGGQTALGEWGADE